MARRQSRPRSRRTGGSFGNLLGAGAGDCIGNAGRAARAARAITNASGATCAAARCGNREAYAGSATTSAAKNTGYSALT